MGAHTQICQYHIPEEVLGWYLRAGFAPPQLQDGSSLLLHILHHPILPAAAPAVPNTTSSTFTGCTTGFVGAAAACPGSPQPPTCRRRGSLKRPCI